MSRAFDLECLAVALARAAELAVRCGLDPHIVSDIRHALAAVEANKGNRA